MVLLIVYFDVFKNDLIKRLKENNIAFEIVKYDEIDLKKHYDTVIITGSKKRILRQNHFPLLEQLLSRQSVNILGICFGFQYLAIKSGGKVIEDNLFKGFRSDPPLFFNHHDKVVSLPKLWKVVDRQEDFINVAATGKWIGFQFHPEKDPAIFAHYMLPFLRI
jgi:GMP synthase-like glutamine amidotransferase